MNVVRKWLEIRRKARIIGKENKLDNFPVLSNVKKIIREDRLDKNVLAKRMGCSIQELNSMLDGDEIIKVSDIARLCMVLGVDANTLFQR